MSKCRTCSHFIRPSRPDVARGLCAVWDVRRTQPRVEPGFSCARWQPLASKPTPKTFRLKLRQVIAALQVSAQGLTACRLAVADLERMLQDVDE